MQTVQGHSFAVETRSVETTKESRSAYSQRVLLKVVTSNGESGIGNREPEFGNEFTAVIRMKSQNETKRKRKKNWGLLYDHALFELDRRRENHEQ